VARFRCAEAGNVEIANQRTKDAMGIVARVSAGCGGGE
jgi:hypothetical protein